ncbi:hypothetical protein D3C85_1367340 [compost metagenome]
MRLLGQGAGENHPLFFTSGQCGEGVVFKALEAHRCQCLFGDAPVFKGIAIEQTLMRGTSHGDHVIDRQAKGIGKFLQHYGDALRTPA